MLTEKKQIFIVDDDESVCRSLKCLLLTFGFKVDTFLSVEKFISSVPHKTPGTLILDIYLQGLSGWEALKWIIHSGSKRPVIIVTADRSGLREDVLKAGAVGFFQKPVNALELVDLINKTY